MECEVITVGTELTTGLLIDTHSAYIAGKLLSTGVECTRHTRVSDNVDAIADAIVEALKRADIVILTGGLGSTVDDVTREAISKATGKKLVFDTRLGEIVQEKFKRYDEELPEFVLKQAYLPEGSRALEPDTGTAPGIAMIIGGKALYALPGIPREMKAMFIQALLPEIKKIAPSKPILVKTVKTCGVREAFLAEKIAHADADFSKVQLTYIPRHGEVDLRIMVRGAPRDLAQTYLLQAEQRLADILGPVIYGSDEDTLEKVVGDLLRKYDLKVAVAESCTGGLISHRLTNIAGSSDYFWGGIVAYSNEMKKQQTYVPKETLLKEGSVSSATALALAEGIRQTTGVDIGLGITGIAGPGGGTPQKPVGLVFVTLSTKEKIHGERFQFWGTREDIKFETSQAALDILRLFILEEFEEGGTAA